MAKAWPEAGDAFSKAVELHVKLGSTYDAANAAQEAANCFKNVRASSCIKPASPWRASVPSPPR